MGLTRTFRHRFGQHAGCGPEIQAADPSKEALKLKMPPSEATNQ